MLGEAQRTVCRLTLPKYSTSHAKSSLLRHDSRFRYTFPPKKLLRPTWNCGESLSRSLSCCRPGSRGGMECLAGIIDWAGKSITSNDKRGNQSAECAALAPGSANRTGRRQLPPAVN